MNTFIALVNVLGAAVLLMGSVASADEVYSKTEAANRLYKQGKFEEALKLYEDALLLAPAEDNLKINRGAALYQKGDLDQAEKSSQAALSAKEKKTRAVAHYNLGNIMYRKGETLMQQDPGKAKEQFKQALDNYIKALDINSGDYDAKWNLQLAHNRIEQMKQQQQQQDKNQQNKDKNDNKDENQKQNDQQDNNNQDKNQENKQDGQDKKDQEQKQDQQKPENDEQNKSDSGKSEQQQQPQPAEQDSLQMKKDEARRIIELYADDADSLNKPVKKGIGKHAQPEKDW